MPQKSLEKLDSAPQLETGLETACTSRRGLFLGAFALGALGLSTLSSPARGAVSMLRTGLDPEQLETEGEGKEQLEPENNLEEVGYYRWKRSRRRRRWRRRRRPRVGIRIWI